MMALVAAAVLSAAEPRAETTFVYPVYGHTLGINKVGQRHLDIYSFFRVRFDDPQCLAAVRLKARDDPTTKDDDPKITVYGVNSGENMIIYNRSMSAISFYHPEEGAGRLSRPTGIAADPDGNVFVADTGNRRVAHLANVDGDLHYRGEIGKGRLAVPAQVAIDSRTNVYVTDTSNDRLFVFDRHGKVVREIGGFSGPFGLAVADPRGDRWLSQYGPHTNGAIAVVDRRGTRLSVLDLSGKRIGEADVAGVVGRERVRVHSVAIDLMGNFVLTDRENHCLHKLGPGLEFLVTFGRRGPGDGEFEDPRGITIWRRFGQTFVAEATGAQYFWIGTDVLWIRAERQGESEVRFTLFVTERAYLKMEYATNDGEPQEGFRRRYVRAGENSFRWRPRGLSRRARDGKLPPLPPGDYLFRFTFWSTYSAATHHPITREVELRIPR